jgi:rhodanese-related sulfurtransferase
MGLAACTSPVGGDAPDPAVRTLFPEEAAAAARQGTRTLIDVRLGEEAEAPPVAALAAAHVPFDPDADAAAFARRAAAAVGGDRARPVALLCLVGVRSGWAAQTLARHGFADVATVHDGYRGWPDIDE